MDYEARWCEHCIHRPTADGLDCPILELHAEWNYDQAAGSEQAREKGRALSVFIPRSEDGLQNEQCRMFVEAPRVLTPLQIVKQDLRREILGPQLAEDLAAR